MKLVVLSAIAGIGFLAMADTTTAPATTTAPTTSAPATSETAAPAAPASSTTATVAQPSDSKFWAFLELRPTYLRTNGKVDTEDTIELGYQFAKGIKLSYAQFLKTELIPSGEAVGKGVNLRGDGGFVRMRVNDFYVSDSKKTRLSYQGRIYTPTYPEASDESYIGTLYNGIALHQDIGDVTLSFWEVPMIHVYSKNGFLSAKNPTDPTKNTANPMFQNRMMIIADWNITKTLQLSFPLILDISKARSFAAAAGSEQTTYNFWIWPEINYTLNDVHTIGIGYRSKNLVTSDLKTTDFSGAFRSGVLQAIWGVNL